MVKKTYIFTVPYFLPDQSNRKMMTAVENVVVVMVPAVIKKESGSGGGGNSISSSHPHSSSPAEKKMTDLTHSLHHILLTVHFSPLSISRGHKEPLNDGIKCTNEHHT